MKADVTVRVDDVLAALQPLATLHKVSRISQLAGIVPDFNIRALVDHEAIAAEAGFVDPDICSDEARSEMEPSVRDLHDGLRALIDGDRHMAAILLVRAFRDWPDASRAAEDVLLSRTIHDHRQPTLLVA